MLLLDAEIYFDTKEENLKALSWDLDPSAILRPTISFDGGKYLWSGQLVFDKSEKMIMRGKQYRAIIQMFTIIDDESFELLKHYVKKNAAFTLHAGTAFIGSGKVLDYLYESDDYYFGNRD